MSRRVKRSIVAERLEAWLGRPVTIRTSWGVGPELVTIEAVIPAGGRYFAAIVDAAGRRLVAIDHVIEIAEVVS